MHSNHNEISYNIWSSFYDKYPNPTVAIDDLNFPKIYSRLRAKSVLEIGCGTGRHTQRLLDLGNFVTAIDLSEGMLEVAKKKISSEKVTFLKGNILEDQIPNPPFQAAVMSLVLEHIEDLPQFFTKIRELLISGGKFYFSEIHPERTAEGVMAHFKNTDGTEIHLKGAPHTQLDISNAAEKRGFEINNVETILGSKELIQLNPKWEKYLKKPMIQIWGMSAV